MFSFCFSVDMLLTQPIERDGCEMPSPAQLKRKIIIKVFYIKYSLFYLASFYLHFNNVVFRMLIMLCKCEYA